MKHAFGLVTVLFGVWLAWSGHYTPMLIGLGALSCFAVVALALRMGLVDDEGAPLALPFGLPRYMPYLLFEILKSNLDVARRILHPRLPIQPAVFRTRASQSTDLGKVVYANSITLTPGTVSIGLEADEIVVHALSRRAADGVRSGEMDRRVARLDRRA